jgi:hypothetical protein
MVGRVNEWESDDGIGPRQEWRKDQIMTYSDDRLLANE